MDQCKSTVVDSTSDAMSLEALTIRSTSSRSSVLQISISCLCHKFFDSVTCSEWAANVHTMIHVGLLYTVSLWSIICADCMHLTLAGWFRLRYFASLSSSYFWIEKVKPERLATTVHYFLIAKSTFSFTEFWQVLKRCLRNVVAQCCHWIWMDNRLCSYGCMWKL